MNILNKVLLVEDSPKDLELTLEALVEQHLANSVDVVRDGIEALDYLYCRGSYENRTDEMPVVVLLDLKMPRMGGLEFLRRLKSDPQLEDIPVIVMTSSHEEKDYINSQKLGTVAYTFKPIRFENLMDSIAQLDLNCLPSSDMMEWEICKPSE